MMINIVTVNGDKVQDELEEVAVADIADVLEDIHQNQLVFFTKFILCNAE